jgi:hypothetical protein
VRTLPLRLSPVDGESLPSYVIRYAHAFGLPPGDLIRALGLDQGTGSVAAAGRYGVTLPADRLAHASFVTGIASKTLKGMLLARYAGRAFDRSALSTPVPLQGPPEGHDVLIWSSRFCPRCLAEDGAWLLRWQLCWSAVCLDHCVLLARFCPECGAVPEIGPHARWRQDGRGVLTDPTRCWHRRQRELCRGRLAAARAINVADIPALLTAQRRIYSVLEGQLEPTLGGEKLPPQTYLHDMRTLCNLLHLHVLQPGQPQPRSQHAQHRLLSDPAAVSTVLPEALRLADLPDQDALADALRQIADERHRADSHTLVVSRIREASPILRAALRQAWSETRWAPPMSRIGLHPRAHRRPADLDDRLQARHVPQLFWARDYQREISELFEFDDFTHWHGRRFCSVMLVRMLKPLNWDAAIRYLDLPETFINKGYNTTSVKLRAHGRLDELLRRIKRIANQHARERLIDYKQRRVQLAHWSGIDRDTWQLLQPRLPQNHRWRSDVPSRRARAGVWLWCELTSGHERAAPIALPTSNLAHQGEFIRDALPDLRERLLILGQLLLATPKDASHMLPAQLEAALREDGYVIFRPDPTDRRRRLEAHERRERPKPPRVPQTLADRVLAHVAAHTGVDIPTLTDASFPGMQTPPAVIHARLLAAALLQRIAPTSWNAIGEAINQDGNQLADRQHAYQAARQHQPPLAGELDQLQRAIENPQTPAPIIPGTPHHQRMRELAKAIQARAIELLATSYGADIARRASITTCREHTDLTCDVIAAIHRVRDAQPTHCRATIAKHRQADPDFNRRYQQLLDHAQATQQQAGFANASLKRALTPMPRRTDQGSN